MTEIVRIVVAGNKGTGKSSLIVTASTGTFLKDVPPVQPPARWQSDIDNFTCTLIDSSSSEDSRYKLEDELKQADAVLLTYAFTDPSSLEDLTTFWLPELRRLQVIVPVIVVGCKLDLRNEEQSPSLEDKLASLMEQFLEVETCIECSALNYDKIREVFYYTQRAVANPTAPLFDQEALTFKLRCVRALTRIFRLCDHDRDGALNDAELKSYQVKCFNAPLQHYEIMNIKRVVTENVPQGVNGHGVTLRGFLFIQALFLQRGQPEKIWTVLRKFGYQFDRGQGIKLTIPNQVESRPQAAEEGLLASCHNGKGISDHGYFYLRGSCGVFMLQDQISAKLLPHQTLGVEWLWSLHQDSGKGGGIMADDMGLGKTRQICAFLAGLYHCSLVEKGIILIVPKTLLSTWAQEMSFVGLSDRVYNCSLVGRNYRSTKLISDLLKVNGILLTSYGLASREASFSREDLVWDYMILDEGGKIKNPHLQKTKRLNEIKALHRIIITGTPLQNSLMEFWALFNFCCPMLLGDEKNFKKKYEHAILYGQEKNASEDQKRIASIAIKGLREAIKPHFLRRLKSEVFDHTQISKKHDFVVWLKLSVCQRELYRAAMMSKFVSAKKGSHLSLLTVLKKVCDHPLLFDRKAYEDELKEISSLSNEDLDAAQKFASEIANLDVKSEIEDSCKISFILSLLAHSLPQGHKFLIFSQSRKMIDLIQVSLRSNHYDLLRIDGKTTIRDRENIVKKFQDPEGARIFLLTTQVGGVGLTLTQADRVIVVDPSWNPSVDDQTVDRAYRLGQRKDVVVFRLMSCATVEERIYMKQVFKRGLSKTIVEMKSQVPYFSQEELQKLFSVPGEQDFDVSLTKHRLDTVPDEQYDMGKKIEAQIDYVRSLDEVAGLTYHSSLFTKTEPLAGVLEDVEETRYGGGPTLAQKVISSGVCQTKLAGVSTRGSSRGLTGLFNLGNTCYMNSAIQCLLHTPVFAAFFLDGAFYEDITWNKPSGKGGEFATGFSELLQKLWNSREDRFSPWAFKTKLVSFASQYSGSNQHDSQEFLGLLLNMLHEDLNRVKKKPDTKPRDADGRPDGEIADEYWSNHIAQNDSIIVDVWQGLSGSTLVCPVCNETSVTFDTFMHLSLPLQSLSMRTMTVTVFTCDGSAPPAACTISVPEQGCCKDLIHELSTTCSLKHNERVLLAEIRDHSVNRFLEDPSMSLSSINDNDHLAAYKIPKCVKHFKFLQLIHRRKEQGVSRTTEWKLCGTPLVSLISCDGTVTRGDIHSVVHTMLSPRDANRSEVITSMRLPLQLVYEDGKCIDLSVGDEIAVKLSSLSRSIQVFVDWSHNLLDSYETTYLETLAEVKNGSVTKRTESEPLSLYSCLETYLREEQLGPEAMWHCPKCDVEQQASKKLDLWRLPEVLVIHLERSSERMHKLETFVDFPIHDFELTNFVADKRSSRQHLYELYAVINHYGGMEGGHYTATIKHLDKDRWYNFDDEKVSLISEGGVRSEAAYVLFYKRVKADKASN